MFLETAKLYLGLEGYCVVGSTGGHPTFEVAAEEAVVDLRDSLRCLQAKSTFSGDKRSRKDSYRL